LSQKTLCYMGTQLPHKRAHSSPNYSAYVYCGQAAGWISMPFGTEEGLGPGHIVLHGDSAPPKRGTATPNFRPCLLAPNGWMDECGTWYGGRSRPRQYCVRSGPSPPSPQKRALQPHHFSARIYCGQTAGWIKMPLGTEIGLSPGHIVLDGDPAPHGKGTAAPTFRPMFIVAKRSPISATAELVFF